MEDALTPSSGRFPAGQAGVPEERAARWLLPIPQRLCSLAKPFAGASGFYASSWHRYLTRQAGSDLPVVRPTVALAAHAFRDEIVLAGFRMLRPTDRRAFARIEREVMAAIDRYGEAGWLERPEGFFVAPPPLTQVTARTAQAWRHTYERVSFVSGYEPHPGEPGRDRWLGYTPNNRAHAWMLRHDEPRPWLVCVHGAVMGRPMLDLTLFRAQRLHKELGLNVILPVLPLHGPRRRDLPDNAMFPGEDVLDNVHGAAHAVWDIRRLLSWIRSQDPGSPIGFSGISLGGYVTSLVAGLEDGLACAIVGVPAIDLVDLHERHGGLTPGDVRRQAIRLARCLGRVVSPLALTPRVPHEGRFIYAGLADRLVHPREQVIRLWEHWDRPEITWYPGGHTGFFSSRPVTRFIEEALTRSGLVHGSPATPGSHRLAS
ncbi:MAG: hypothetical protein ACM3ML_18490 [Micromonosporaceae bacterium]